MQARSTNSAAKRDQPTSPSMVELGCGDNKREGFFGIDIIPAPSVDLVLDYETQPLPFADNSVEYFYSNHSFEHLHAPGSPIMILREIVRTAKHGARVEIWTPYGRSNDAFLFGHYTAYNEKHWKHICFQHDDFYLGHGALGRFVWDRTQYVLPLGILEQLGALNIPLEFALRHMFDVAYEFGVFLTVDKTITESPKPQNPVEEICYQRGQVLRTLAEGHAKARSDNKPLAPFRHVIADRIDSSIRALAPWLHPAAKSLARRVLKKR